MGKIKEVWVAAHTSTHLIQKGLNKMHTNYNMNQLTLDLGKIYARRKIDVETVFRFMKACLGFTRYTVRGLDKVRKHPNYSHQYDETRKKTSQVR